MSKNLKGFPMIKMPSKEELSERVRKRFLSDNENPNNLSFWFEKIKDCGFPVPETRVIPLTFEWYEWIRSDNYKPEKIEEFSVFIIEKLKESNFNTDRTLFLKSGTFSNKFQFNQCKLEDIGRIGHQCLEIMYTSMLFGADKTAEIIVREFIHNPVSKKCIYEGMPLNTEFRIFYDFDKKAVMGSFNYWKRDVMMESLEKRIHDETSKNEYDNFMESIDAIEFEYNENIAKLINEVSEKMFPVELTGKWSIDFMKIEDKFYLIDMAIASESYYFNELNENG